MLRVGSVRNEWVCKTKRKIKIMHCNPTHSLFLNQHEWWCDVRRVERDRGLVGNYNLTRRERKYKTSGPRAHWGNVGRSIARLERWNGLCPGSVVVHFFSKRAIDDRWCLITVRFFSFLFWSVYWGVGLVWLWSREKCMTFRLAIRYFVLLTVV